MSDQEREIETGFLCENPNCHEPIEDSRPAVQDWRVPKGRTKRLCAKCAEWEEKNVKRCESWCAGRPGHSGECFEIYSHRDTCPGAPDCIHDEELENIGERTVNKLERCIDAVSDFETAFTRMFRAEGVGPRTKMKRYLREYK